MVEELKLFNPDRFRVDDIDVLTALIQCNPLGTLISVRGEIIQTSYLPFLLEEHDGAHILLGHLAKANDHWESLADQTVVVSFKGPNKYVSPTEYADGLNVPTWNYAVVEVYGIAEVICDTDIIESIPQKSVIQFEQRNKTAWVYDLPNDFRQTLLKMILGLRIKVKRIEGKFKLGQNRSEQDYQALLDSLAKSTSERDKDIFRLMNQLKR
jgi:transcriptional regulator